MGNESILEQILVRFGVDTSALQSGFNQAKGTSGDLMKSFTQLTGITLGVGAAIAGASRFVRASIDDYSNLARETRSLSNLTGMQAEQSSTLIAVMDDLELDINSVTGAMQFAARNGFNPTLDNLIALSQRYQSIQDPAQRTNLLFQTFGRSGADLALFLSQDVSELRAMEEQIQGTAQVMSQEGVDGYERYYAALDTVSDRWLNLKLQLAEDIFIPVATNVLNGVDAILWAVTDMGDQVRGVYDIHNEEMITTTSNYSDYTAEMLRAARASGLFTENIPLMTYYLNRQADGLHLSGTAQDRLNNFMIEANILSETQYYNAQLFRTISADMYGDAKGSADEYVDSLIDVNSYTANALQSALDLRGGFESLNDLDLNLAETILDEMDQVAFAAAGGGQLQAARDAINAALTSGGITAEQANAMFSELYVKAMALEVDLNNMTLYEAALEIRDQLGIPLQEAYDLLEAVNDDFASIPDEVHSTIFITEIRNAIQGGAVWTVSDTAAAYTAVTGQSAGTQSGGGQNSSGGEFRAGGGDINAFMPYWVGEEGPELVIPTQSGTVIPADQSARMASSYGGPSAREIGYETAIQLQRLGGLG